MRQPVAAEPALEPLTRLFDRTVRALRVLGEAGERVRIGRPES